MLPSASDADQVQSAGKMKARLPSHALRAALSAPELSSPRLPRMEFNFSSSGTEFEGGCDPAEDDNEICPSLCKREEEKKRREREEEEKSRRREKRVRREAWARTLRPSRLSSLLRGCRDKCLEHGAPSCQCGLVQLEYFGLPALRESSPSPSVCAWKAFAALKEVASGVDVQFPWEDRPGRNHRKALDLGPVLLDRDLAARLIRSMPQPAGCCLTPARSQTLTISGI